MSGPVPEGPFGWLVVFLNAKETKIPQAWQSEHLFALRYATAISKKWGVQGLDDRINGWDHPPLYARTTRKRPIPRIGWRPDCAAYTPSD